MTHPFVPQCFRWHGSQAPRTMRQRCPEGLLGEAGPAGFLGLRWELASQS